MLIADYHIHSTASSDARNTMAEMVEASAGRGVSQICFTDHCDLDEFGTGRPNANCRESWPAALSQYKAACKTFPDADIRLGIELGEINHNPELASEIAAAPELDFVLGALHNLRNTPDFYHLPYRSEEHCRELILLYLDELVEMSRLTCFDVMAHVGYASKYMINSGFEVRLNLAEHGDRLESLFKSLIERGKGIECNCSGYRHPRIAGPVPSAEILRFYRELGGEIITVGTDAHNVRDAGLNLDRGYALLRELGFKRIATYKKRKPEFMNI